MAPESLVKAASMEGKPSGGRSDLARAMAGETGMTDLKQGARRIKIVGQLTVVLGVLVMIVFFALPSYRDFIALLFTTLYALIAPILIGLLVWATGWILEGFSGAAEAPSKTSAR